MKVIEIQKERQEKTIEIDQNVSSRTNYYSSELNIEGEMCARQIEMKFEI